MFASAIMPLAFLVLPASCNVEEKEMGKTIDEVEIIVRDNTPAKNSISYEQALALADITPLMKSKAADFTAASQNADSTLFNCLYVYASATSEYESAPAKLAARIWLLGYKGIYLSPGGSRLRSADPWLKTFISTASGLGMKVYATYYESNQIYLSETAAQECLNAVITYNKMVKFEERFAGVAADLEPHTIKTDIGTGYIWNTQNNMGVGKANDELMRITVERLQYASKILKLSGLKLQQALWCHNQRYYNEGKLSHGNIPEFTEVCDWVSLMAYSNSTDNIWNISVFNLEAGNRPGSVNICVKTATNDEPGTTILPNGWAALLETMSGLRTRGGAYPAFGGLDMFQYAALEDMWEWTNDKN